MGPEPENAGAIVQRQIIDISDPDDPDICGFKQIRERDLVRQHHQIIIEGRVVLQHLLLHAQDNKRVRLTKLLVLENRFDGIRALLDKLPSQTRIFRASRQVMDEIAGFPIHRGILGLADFEPDLHDWRWLDKMPTTGLVLVLSQISNHDNIGAIFRNAAAFGVDHIVLDGKCCHPFYRKSIRVSVGAALSVPFHYGCELDEALDRLAMRDFSLYGLTPHQGTSLADVAPKGRNALVLGTEGTGLLQEHLQRLKNLTIEQSQHIDSLNVATASGLALWTFARKLGRI